MKKLVTLMIFLLILSMTLAGCGDSSKPAAQGTTKSADTTVGSKPVTISYWYTANEADEADYFPKWQDGNRELFQIANPHITVEKTVVSNSDQYQTKLNASIAAGDIPDIFVGWFAGRLEPFVRSGSVMALDDIINEDEELKNTYIPYKLAQFDGKTYAIGYTLTTEVYFYNKGLFAEHNAEVPKSYEELMNLIELFKSKGIIPMAMGNQDPWVGSLPYMFVFDRIAGPLKYEETCFDRTGKFTDPEYIRAAEIVVEIAEAGAYPNNFNTLNYDEARALFTSGKAAMYPMGTWELANLANVMGDNVSFFNFPDIEGGKGKAEEDWVCSQDGATSISAKSSPEKTEAAIKFLKYIFSRERLSDLAMSGALVPAKGLILDETKLPKITVDIYNQLSNVKYGIIPWDNLLGPNVGKEFNLSTQSIYAGKDPAEVFANLQKIAEMEWSSN
ncbi:MAG: extracellular solute-binding protein [Clostridiaceae bacterium]|nr:extracellular solute-binding protein [Clostridiaceae bacterium]